MSDQESAIIIGEDTPQLNTVNNIDDTEEIYIPQESDSREDAAIIIGGSENPPQEQDREDVDDEEIAEKTSAEAVEHVSGDSDVDKESLTSESASGREENKEESAPTVMELIFAVAQELQSDSEEIAKQLGDKWAQSLVANDFSTLESLHDLSLAQCSSWNIPAEAYELITQKLGHDSASSQSIRHGLCEDEQIYDKYGFRPPKGGKLPEYPKESEKFLRKRVKKWRTMLENWPKWMSDRRLRAKVKSRARKGIPESIRGQAWQVISGSIATMQANPGVFQDLLELEPDRKDLDIIMRDLDRTYPTHVTFEDPTGRGQMELRMILKAFAVYRPHVGYVQGMGMLTGMLLMHMPMENAFWSLVTMMDKYIPGMFDKHLSQFHIDCGIFQALLAKRMKSLNRHMESMLLDPIMYATKWFLCIFTLSLPWETVLRVWDCFMFEGVQIVFSAGMAIVHLAQKELLKLQHAGELINHLNNIDPMYTSIPVFLPTLFKVKVKRKELIREHYRQLEQWEQTKRDMTPDRREDDEKV